MSSRAASRRLLLPFFLVLAAPVAADRPWNVLVLTGDALRADHLGAYGYSRPTSPHLDAFAAQEATLFRHAVGHAAWTAPGIVSLVTGLYPAVHAVDTRHKTMDERFPTAVKELVRRGYHPAAFQSVSEPYVNLGLGAEDLMRFPLVEVLRRHVEEPFVLWYHLRQTHLPYAAEEETRRRFHRPDAPALAPEALQALLTEHMIPAGKVAWDLATRPAVEDLYDARVHELDAEVGQAFAALRELGLWERTIVVVTADHGEELLERGEVGHASTTLKGTLHQEILAVPLLVRVPGIPGGRVVEDLAQPIDVMPTVFEALGLPAWPHLQGRSLLAAMRGERGAGRPYAFSDSTDCGWQCPSNRRKTARLKAVRDRRWKLLVDLSPAGERTERLYDLASDPGELHDVLRQHPEEARRLAAALAAHERRNLDLARDLVGGVLDRHLEELRALSVAERANRAAETCDEIAMLRYVYDVETPSLWRTRAGRALWKRATRTALRLVGGESSRYWSCARLAGS